MFVTVTSLAIGWLRLEGGVFLIVIAVAFGLAVTWTLRETPLRGTSLGRVVPAEPVAQPGFRRGWMWSAALASGVIVEPAHPSFVILLAWSTGPQSIGARATVAVAFGAARTLTLISPRWREVVLRTGRPVSFPTVLERAQFRLRRRGPMDLLIAAVTVAGGLLVVVEAVM